jgi:hypothetical protein
MVPLQVYSSALERLEMPGRLCRAEAREFGEVTDQVRLVEESAVDSQVAPFQRLGMPHVCQDPLEPLDPVKQLRCETNLSLEHLDESSVTEADPLSDFMHGRAPDPLSASTANRTTSPCLAATDSRDIRSTFEDAELVEGAGRVAEPLAKFAA